MNNDIEICPLTLNDIDDILDISALSFPIPWSRNSFVTELGNNFARYVVAKKGDKVIGYGGIWIIVDEGDITNIAIHPDYRGLGASNLILEALISICRKENIIAMTLEVRISNNIAQNLYKKHDFVEEGIRKKYYEDNKEDAVIMWKRNL